MSFNCITIKFKASLEKEYISRFIIENICIKCNSLVREDFFLKMDHMFCCLSEEELKIFKIELLSFSTRFVSNKYIRYGDMQQIRPVLNMTLKPVSVSESVERPITPEFKYNLVEEIMGIHNTDAVDDNKLTASVTNDMKEKEIMDQVSRIDVKDGKDRLKQIDEFISREKAKLSMLVDKFDPEVRELVKEVCRNMLSDDLVSNPLPDDKQSNSLGHPYIPSKVISNSFVKPSAIAGLRHSSSFPGQGSRTFLSTSINSNSRSKLISTRSPSSIGKKSSLDSLSQTGMIQNSRNSIYQSVLRESSNLPTLGAKRKQFELTESSKYPKLDTHKEKTIFISNELKEENID
eukprot:NODE_499_length_6752_cov_0.698482.p2 type:complete len:348 gc:universal NODE_499_length_6752_cov_0.698482:2123-3166(+)